MARIRTIKPEFWTDEQVGELSSNARLLFLATWNFADDEGLIYWNPSLMRSLAFPYDDMSVGDVEALMLEITERGLVHPYKDAKQKVYGWVPNFRKHQKIDRPQAPKHPLPSLQNPSIRARYAERDGWKCAICGSDIDPKTDMDHRRLSLDHILPVAKGGTDIPSNIRATHFGCNAGRKDSKGEEYAGSARVRGVIDESSSLEGKGREGKGEEKEVGRAKRAPHNSGTKIPPGFPGEAEFAYPRSRGWSETQIQEQAFEFREYWLSPDAAKGGRKKDWKGTWERWVRNTRRTSSPKQSQSEKDDAAFREAARRIGANQ